MKTQEEFERTKETYICKNCGEEWGWYPEDYEDSVRDSWICPLCSMPLRQMIRDTYDDGGIREVLLWLRRRYFSRNK